MDQVPDCDVASHRELVAGSYPDYFLCEVELAPWGYWRCPRCMAEVRGGGLKCPQCGFERPPTWSRIPTDGSKNLYILTACATGGWRGGRRVSMPGLRRLVSSAVELRAAGESGIPAQASMGSEQARSHDRDLPSMRADVGDPFAAQRGAVRESARPALSSSSETQEARACAPE